MVRTGVLGLRGKIQTFWNGNREFREIVGGGSQAVAACLMNELFAATTKLEREISAARGEFSLFALFLREDSPDRWDVIVAAPWLSPDDNSGLRYLAGQLQSGLPVSELVRISRIVILREDDPIVLNLRSEVDVKRGPHEVVDIHVFGLDIKRAYFIAVRPVLAHA